MNKEFIAIIHNVRSLHNVGSVFRTADGAGVSKIYLTGYTPSPIDEMGRIRKEIIKTALGAEQSIKWETVKNISAVTKRLKKEGVQIVALEKAKNSVDYKKFKPKFPVALIVGNEVRGLSSTILTRADAIISIPMLGKKESLNVSVAFGIAAYSILK